MGCHYQLKHDDDGRFVHRRCAFLLSCEVAQNLLQRVRPRKLHVLELSHYMKQDKFSYNLAHAIYDSNRVLCSVGGSESLVRVRFQFNFFL